MIHLPNIKELWLITKFLWNPPKYVYKLSDHLWARTYQLTYFNCPLIHTCLDIFGYEVSVGLFSGPWLDTRPGEYKLTKYQGDMLFNAVVSCIPGSIHYQSKHPMKEFLA